MRTSYTPAWFTRQIQSGDEGRDVLAVQRKVGATPTGVFDAETAVRVRGAQQRAGQKVTGIVDEALAEWLGEEPVRGLTPPWFTRVLRPGDSGPDVDEVIRLLGMEGETLSPAIEAGIRRFQSAHRIHPTGVVDETVAKELGE